MGCSGSSDVTSVAQKMPGGKAHLLYFAAHARGVGLRFVLNYCKGLEFDET